ncbi:MAG: methyl-accepting chemotaxis protein [Treponema sp.]|jgi:methyl-accepting chemotaxis protein|nr:methyl-accepting chemotaxis protein [Treponema sp.]
MKIGLKLTVIMILLSVVSIGSVGITLLIQSKANISHLAYDHAASSAREAANEIQAFFETYYYTAETLAQVMEQYQHMILSNRRNMLNLILEGVAKENPEIIGLWCILEPDVLEGNDQQYIGFRGATPEGRFAPYYYWEDGSLKMYALDDFDGPEGSYYQVPKRNNATTIMDPFLYDVGGTKRMMTTVASPIRNNGRLVGVVGLDISLDEIQTISQTDKIYADAVTAVFSNNGTIAAHFDPSRVGNDMRQSEQDMTGPYMNEFVSAIHDGKEFSFSNYIAGINAHLEIFAVPIAMGETTSPWSYAIGIMTETVLAPVYQMIKLTILISLGMLAAMAVASVFLSRSITKPIINVTATLKDIAEGEGDLTRVISEIGRNEITELSHYFNQTLEKIKNLIITIKKQTTILFDTGTELSSNMTETAAAVNQITANIQSIKGRIINQSASVTQTNATMEQMTVNIDRLNDHVDNQTNSVSQSSSAIEEMIANIQSVTNTLVKNTENVHELSSASEVGRTGLQEVAADIKKISSDSAGLMEINSVMKNIASQTNLLSMNAAIEAAHAGEAGKGFAVVADEIRKLAESSSEQSKTIGNVLKTIKGSIDKITRSTENVLTEFELIDKDVKTVAEQEENIRNAMEEQGEGSKQVLGAIGRLNEITQQVKGGSTEMLEGSKEVILESKNLEKVTQEITGSMNEMASGTEQINVAVHRVNEISGKNRENIDMLIQEVSRFKVE